MPLDMPGEAQGRPDRCHGIDYQDVFDMDSRPVPAFLREESVPDLGSAPVAASRYTDPAFFALEREKVFFRTWQMACRVEEIPNPGDTVIYDLLGKSLLIVRTQTGAIKALQNVCLHRGRKLATQGGCKSQLRCPFHGFAWNIDGTFKENPMPWDFPDIDEATFNLPEVRTHQWGGFVFVNFDAQAPDFDTVAAPIPEHFRRYALEDTYKWIHVARKIPANWKAVAEAFMESHHSYTTHPQLLPYLADTNSKYDAWGDHVTRHMSAMGIPSPLVDASRYTQDDILHHMFGTSGRTGGADEGGGVPEGATARQHASEMLRAMFAAEDGYDYSDKSDTEILDPILYNLFPNQSYWAGFGPNLVYRWTPIDVDNTVMEIIRLKRVPKGGERPKPCEVHWIADDQPFSSAEELGPLGLIFDQDMGNLPFVQEGLKALGPDGQVQFGRYAEMRLRLLHQTIDKMIAGG